MLLAARSLLSTYRGPKIIWTTFDTPTSTTVPSLTFNDFDFLGNGEGVFTNRLPSTGQYYFDITLNYGYDSDPTRVGFFGIANAPGDFSNGATGNYKAWYWSSGWFGDATTLDDGTGYSTLSTGLYRVAVDRTNGRFYIKRLSRGGDVGFASGIRAANLPTGSNMYCCMMSQGGYRIAGCTMENGGLIIDGKGGLY